jgi:BASS family bile acid:Na+ symporter
MSLQSLVVLAIQLSIMATVFGFGLRARMADLLHLVHRPGLLARSLLAVFVVMPLFAVVVATAFDFPRTVQLALVALAIAPLPPVLPRKQGKAGGDTSYAIALIATIALLAIAIVPLSLELLARLFHQDFAIPFSSVALLIVKTTLAPLAAGMIVHWMLPAVADRIERPLALVGTTLLALGALVVIAGSLPAIWAQIGNGAIYACVAFVVVGLAVGHLLGGPEDRDRAVLALATACRHPAIALAIASANAPDERFGAIIVLYLLLSTLIGLPYVMWRKRIAAGAASAQ